MYGKYRRLADEALFFFAFSVFSGAYIDLPIRFASERWIWAPATRTIDLL